MSPIIDVYARLTSSLFIFLIRSTYRQPSSTSFSAEKHNKMIKLKDIADKAFNLMAAVVGEKTKYNYAMPFNYEGCKLLIRPFIFSEVIMVSGLWEPYVKAVLDKEVRKSHTIVDVGASIGAYALPLAKKVNRVIAFEPHPKTSELLKKSIRSNQLKNIVLIEKAVGESAKKVLFGLSNVPMESGIISRPTTDADSNVEIESIDLDTALATENRVDWLLIDAEGSEANVLKGASKILYRYSPKIIIEIFRENVDLVRKILTDEGYSVIQLHDIYYYAAKK